MRESWVSRRGGIIERGGWPRKGGVVWSPLPTMSKYIIQQIIQNQHNISKTTRVTVLIKWLIASTSSSNKHTWKNLEAVRIVCKMPKICPNNHNKLVLFRNGFFICYLAVPKPTLGHCEWDSLHGVFPQPLRDGITFQKLKSLWQIHGTLVC